MTKQVNHWHGNFIFAVGDQAYGHLAAVAVAHYMELADHLCNDHGVQPSTDVVGSWCRDVELHAETHRVIVRKKE